MLCLWLLAGLLPGCLSGGLYSTSAGSTVEAHGPLARLALQPHYGYVTPLHHVPQQVHEDQAAVLAYTTQPRYIQRLVDVANAKVAVAKLQVRRPAIHKQFYDIEERTIVRPVGSAVLELEEPVSKHFVSPFSVVPAGHHTLAHVHRPLLYPVNSYPSVSYRPLQVPVQYYPPSFIQQIQQPPQQYPIISQPPQQVPTIPQEPQQYPIISQPPQQVPTIPQTPQQYPSTTEPVLQVPTTPQFPQQTANTEPQPPQQIPFRPIPDDSSNTEFDSSDTVVVDNPDFTRSSKPRDEPQKISNTEDSFDEFEREVLRDQNVNSQTIPEQERVVQNMISDFENLQLLRMFSSQTGTEKPHQRSQQRPNFNILIEPPKTINQPQQMQNNPSTETQEFQISKGKVLGNNQISTQTENGIETSSELSRLQPSSSSADRELPTLYRSYLDHIRDNKFAASRPHFISKFISSERSSSPEDAQENQRKVLELLTGRGEVSGGETVVRGRVVSVTPQPCAEGQEKVHTRRVVVSRPGHTVQEVDVHQPFTQVQRVAVHEPTLAPILYH